MRKLLTTCALFGTLCGLGVAETWNGTLLDANCSARHHGAKSCDAKPSTAAFALDVNGKTYRLDAKSNDDARSVMKARADKYSNPAATKAVPVTATVTGTLRSSGKIHAKTIELQ